MILFNLRNLIFSGDPQQPENPSHNSDLLTSKDPNRRPQTPPKEGKKGSSFAEDFVNAARTGNLPF